MPADRWSLDRYYDPDPDMPGRMYTRSGGFLQSLWDFDPEFFGISPREASIMDPQQRLLLEVTQEAMDDAGGPAGSPVAVGVYVGAFTADNMGSPTRSRAGDDCHTATAGTFTMLSNRISFVFDLRGPSMTIDTACSSSLGRTARGTQAIARGEIELALVGGVNAMLIPETSVTMCKGRFLAEDGHCKTFDAAADGYARGEGAGILVLKPLADATRDHDRIYAVIRATGVNQDGRTSGIPSRTREAQADLIRRVLSDPVCARNRSGTSKRTAPEPRLATHRRWPLSARPFGRVEGRTARPSRRVDQELHRHTEAAAGVASVIKAALTLHHRSWPRRRRLNRLNPAIPFAEHRISGDHRGRTHSRPTTQQQRWRSTASATAAQTPTRSWSRRRSRPARSSGRRRPRCCRCPDATRSAPVSWRGSCSRSSPTRRWTRLRWWTPCGRDGRTTTTGSAVRSATATTCSPRLAAVVDGSVTAAGRSATAPRRFSCSAGWARNGGGWAQTCYGGRPVRAGRGRGRRSSSPTSPAGR